MAVCCDLEVDVNGEETFMVDKKILISYSGRLCKLFSKSTGSSGRAKVIFHDYPGGAESFELVSRFCYNGGRIEITSGNISLLHCAGHFMEMRSSVAGIQNLVELTEKSLEGVNYWTWHELLVALKQCQDMLIAANASSITEKYLDSLVGRLTLASEASPCPSTSSPDSSGIRLSCDTRSTESLKNSLSQANWWFEELLVLNPGMIDLVIKSMVSRKFDHTVISRFIFYYQKSKSCTSSSDDKRKVLEAVIDMLHTLDWSSVSCKNLFGILRVSLNLGISNTSRHKLEGMIGSQLYQATLDNLLVPAPSGVRHLYDVNLVLRLMAALLSRGICEALPLQMKKVASLMDMYIAEVAPDPFLKPSKFLALLRALPDSARDTYDEIYRAMDMYLEVHAGMSEEEKFNICCVLNCEKLSLDTCIHLSHNAKFPSKTAIKALSFQQFKLKSLLQDTDKTNLCTESPNSYATLGGKGKKEKFCDQIVLYAGKLDQPTDNESLQARLQGMQWRVMELEKVCKKMQTQMAKITKSRVTSHGTTRSLPKLCS